MSEALAHESQAQPELAESQELALTPEQLRAREIMRALAHEMANRVEKNGMMAQSAWRSNQGASIHYMRIEHAGQVSGSLKVHGIGGSFEASEYTLGFVHDQRTQTNEEVLTVQHPNQANQHTEIVNTVDIKFLDYVQAALHDPENEVKPEHLQ